MPTLTKDLKTKIVKQEKKSKALTKKRNKHCDYPSDMSSPEIVISPELNGWTIRSGYDKQKILAKSKEEVLEAVEILIDEYEDDE